MPETPCKFCGIEDLEEYMQGRWGQLYACRCGRLDEIEAADNMPDSWEMYHWLEFKAVIGYPQNRMDS